ncbi:MAG: glycosyltransferase [Symploca sp. SIO2B6]|nr:glycosyltransferase [Symploca sp. SIO2B6]
MLTNFVEAHNHEQLLESLSEKRLVIYTGTLEPYQGIDIVIRAFKDVVSKEADTFLLIVGGTKEQVKQYSSLAEELGITEDCIFTGRVSPSLARYYASHADVQISSRISGTNTPLKIYEQLSRGIPLVATNIYSHTQVLNEEVAFLVEVNPQSMACGILDALSPDGDGKCKAANAKRLYEEKYSRQVYTDKMRNLLEYLTNSSPNNNHRDLAAIFK